MKISILFFLCFILLSDCFAQNGENNLNSNLAERNISIRQITKGPKNHIFGYIGHAKTIPWNGNGRYIVALETEFFERMPEPDEFAKIILIDTWNENKHFVLDSTLAWNHQQGTMLFWNPESPVNQFFFNDLDIKEQVVYTVLYDLNEHRRVKEYRVDNPYVANGGVNPRGKYFIGINYQKVSKSRKVVSYADVRGWSDFEDTVNSDHDGLFRIDIATGESKLLVSYKELTEFLEVKNASTYPIYVHHTLWNRDGDRIFFVVRGDEFLYDCKRYPNAACVISSDGTGLKEVPFTGHREWGQGKELVLGGRFNGYELYDVDQELVVGAFGNKEIFPSPTVDNVMSPNGDFYVSAHYEDENCIYTFYRFADGAYFRSPPILQRIVEDNDCRIDAAPRWNRTSDAILVDGIAKDKTRQLFEIRILTDSSKKGKLQKSINFINFY